MTRATRRGNKKTSLPTATPWKALNREGYTKIEDEESMPKNNNYLAKIFFKIFLGRCFF